MSHHPSQDQAGPPRIYTARAVLPPAGAALAGDARADVAVIGAGFTGLAAALHLAQTGTGVAVLEARTIGWGASGRAFGQVVPYLQHDHSRILAYYGPERGQRIIDAVAAGPSLVFDLINQHSITADAVRTGLLFAAHTKAGRAGLEARTSYWQSRNAPVAMLDRPATAAAIGSGMYATASLDQRGGHLNPYAYAIGLARAAARHGARFYPHTPVRGLRRDGNAWLITTPAGRMRADAVVIATNAYGADLWPGLQRSFVAMRGHALVSTPLSNNLRRDILPGGQPLTDTRRLFSGVRLLPGGELHVSLDGPAFGAESTPFIATAEARIAQLYPQLGKLNWQEIWSGWIAITPDHLPRVHELAPGVFAGLGYSGRGIAAATMMGREIALRLHGTAEADLAFPLSPLRRIPLHGLARLPAAALLRWYRWRDARDLSRSR